MNEDLEFLLKAYVLRIQDSESPAEKNCYIRGMEGVLDIVKGTFEKHDEYRNQLESLKK